VWDVQFFKIHVLNFITRSNLNGSVQHNCDVLFKNMVFHMEFHLSSNWIDEVPNKYHKNSLHHSVHFFFLITTWSGYQYYIPTLSHEEFKHHNGITLVLMTVFSWYNCWCCCCWSLPSLVIFPYKTGITLVWQKWCGTTY